MDSIDVFDTAVFRDVYEPRDIFKLVEDKIGRNFYTKRIEAENKASSLKFYTIADIYRYLIGFDPNIEIEMELNHVYANPKILEMYKKNPNKYVFISDMYLSSKVIKQILEKCGYRNPKVYVSCEEKCNKGSGVLFANVERKVGKIKKHYGDNYRSDIEGCKKQGITPKFCPAIHKMNLNIPSVKSPLLKKYAANLEVSDEASIIKLAKWYAPLIYEFTNWIISKKKKGQHIYFLSRDMFIPYVIASQILKVPEVHYLYCSRRSLAPLFIESKEKPLLDKMKIVLTPEEFQEKKGKIDECMQYLRNCGIRTGDMLVDIGYSGSTQRILEKFLNITLQGMYMQLDQVNPVHRDMHMEMYLNRYALTYRFLAEFVMTSPEDCIETYSNGHVITTPDHPRRKEYAKKFNTVLINEDLYRQITDMHLSVFDVEQMLIHIQNYPSMEMMELFNEPILTNRTAMERGINFDREAILNGDLQECYKKSYARPLFKKMLEADTELASLVKLLP